MAEGVVSFGLQKLWELLSRESGRLEEVHEQVSNLNLELETLNSLLKDANSRRHDSERVKTFLEDIKDIIYDAEDIIDIFLQQEGRDERGNEKGIMKRVRKLACCLVDRRKIAIDIEGITDRISIVIARMHTYGIQLIIDGSHSLSLRQRESRQTFNNNFENNLVGVEQSVENLVGHLVNNNIQVVSISGMGGIGKTTIARQVFHHDIVRQHFHGFAWICVSQLFTRNHIWQRILQELQPHGGDISRMDEYTLQGKLFEMLKTGKYLVVLDDLWRNDHWDQIQAVFPREGGWKMLLTSRNESVGVHVDPTCFSFKPRSLTPEQSWVLCQSIAFPRRGEEEIRVGEELVTLGKEMVKNCGGLPLAVKVLGGLLAQKRPVLAEWRRLNDNIGSQIIGRCGFEESRLSSIYRVLSLSYEDLPMQLKHCFLYLAHFPEDYKIEAEILFGYWAAEGIITSPIRDSGEGYLEELVRRNMVIAEISNLSSRVEYCQMHDIMREVCLWKAEEENFLQVVKAPSSTSNINALSPPSRSRRLAVHSGDSSEVLRRRSNQKVRSLLFLGVEGYFLITSAPGFLNLPLLRVLDLSRVDFQGGELPASIGELIHLRFLSLDKTRLSHVPSSLQKLKLLLYLNLGITGKVHVPNVLKELLELRYLELPLGMDDETKLELGDLVNLEYLMFFSTKHCSVTDLLRMTELRGLFVYFGGGCTSETLLASLRPSTNLEKLSLFGVVDHGGEIVIDFSYLRVLELKIRIPRFSDQHRLPPNLAHISLMYCSMREDPMPTLEILLHLKSVELAYGAYTEKRMVCSKNGFPELCELVLSGQTHLEEWIVEEGSMPCLRSLIINDCKKLKELPKGLKYITSLKELKIVRMRREWLEKLVPGGDDHYKIEHIPNVQFILCD